MSSCGATLEEQLSSIMEVLAKAAVSEISQLFSEGSATLRFQITRSLKENEALRTRMKVMRSELCSLRLTLQTKSSASRAASRSALARLNMSKPRTRPLGHGLKPMMVHKAVGDARSLPPFKSEASSVATAAEETPDVILIKEEEENTSGCGPSVEACAEFGDPSMQQGTASESLHVDAPGSSHMSSRNEELRILCVYGKGQGPLVVDGHDTLFTGLATQGTLSSLSSDHTHDSLLSLDSGPSERVPARGMQDGTSGPSRDDHGERLHRLQAASRSLKHASVAGDNRGRAPGRLGAQFPLQQPKLGFPHGTGKNLGCSFSGKRILSRKLLNVHRAGHTGEPPIPCPLCGKFFGFKATLNVHMRIHTGEKPYECEQCGKRFTQCGTMRRHMRIHCGEKPYVCPQCNASFGDSNYLRRHIDTKHAFNGVLSLKPLPRVIK